MPPDLYLGVRGAAQQYKLPSSLTGAPGRVLDEVDALLVHQTRHTRHLQGVDGKEGHSEM